jgi:hypothetical protein
MELVLSATPDIVESGPYEFTLVSADWNIDTIETELAFEDILNQRVPGDRFTPDSHPALF